MHEIYFLQDLAIVMTVSAVIIILCDKLRIPVVLGYILAGLFIGPHTPPFPLIHNLQNIQTLSELGIIFLLFFIGLEFSLSRLVRVGFVSFVAASLEILVMLGIGYGLGRLFGWKFMDSLFLGAILCISSTTIIAKVLMDTKKIQEKFAQLILGILIIEDLLAIVIIAILSGVASTGSVEVADMAIAMFKVMAFVLVVLFLGFLLIPRILRYLARFENPEMTVIPVLGMCFAVSLAAAKAGFSVALGSFLAGAIIAETPQAKNVIRKMESIKDMFTAIFFVSVGLLIDPAILAKFWFPIMVLTAVTIAGKVASISLATFLAGYRYETALKVGLGLSQIGEFSFIIAGLGESTGVTSSFLYPIAVSVSAVTTLTTPLLMKNTGPIIQSISSILPRPVFTFLDLYTSWIEKMSVPRPEKKRGVGEGLTRFLPRLLFYTVVAFGILYSVSWMQTNFGIFPSEIYWLAVGVIMFPVFIGFVYTLDRLIWNTVLLNMSRLKTMDQAGDSYRLLHNGFRFVLVLGSGLLFLAGGSVFLPHLPLAIAIGSLFLISAFFLWSSVRRTHEKIEQMVLGVFDQDRAGGKQPSSGQIELAQLIREEYPWDVETQDFLLPYSETGATQTLQELKLRSETGASIVSIYRDEETLPNPAPHTRLMPGDVLLLMGDKEQIKNAVQFLQKKVKEPPRPAMRANSPKTLPFEIPTGVRLSGKTLREMRLGRKTGVRVLGIQKAEMTLNNPDPDTVVESGDVLILFGWPEQIEAAQAALSEKD